MRDLICAGLRMRFEWRTWGKDTSPQAPAEIRWQLSQLFLVAEIFVRAIVWLALWRAGTRISSRHAFLSTVDSSAFWRWFLKKTGECSPFPESFHYLFKLFHRMSGGHQGTLTSVSSDFGGLSLDGRNVEVWQRRKCRWNGATKGNRPLEMLGRSSADVESLPPQSDM